MAEIECTVRKWGNSLGIIIPKEIVEEERILENEKLFIEINKGREALPPQPYTR